MAVWSTGTFFSGLCAAMLAPEIHGLSTSTVNRKPFSSSTTRALRANGLGVAMISFKARTPRPSDHAQRACQGVTHAVLAGLDLVKKALAHLIEQIGLFKVAGMSGLWNERQAGSRHTAFEHQ